MSTLPLWWWFNLMKTLSFPFHYLVSKKLSFYKRNTFVLLLHISCQYNSFHNSLMCPPLFLQVDNGKNKQLQYYNSRETYKAGSSTLALQAKEVSLLFRLSEWRLSMTSDLAVLQHYNGITTKLRRITRLRLRCNMTHFVTPTSNLIGVMSWCHILHDSIVSWDNTNRSMTLIKEHKLKEYLYLHNS